MTLQQVRGTERIRWRLVWPPALATLWMCCIAYLGFSFRLMEWSFHVVGPARVLRFAESVDRLAGAHAGLLFLLGYWVLCTLLMFAPYPLAFRMMRKAALKYREAGRMSGELHVGTSRR